MIDFATICYCLHAEDGAQFVAFLIDSAGNRRLERRRWSASWAPTAYKVFEQIAGPTPRLYRWLCRHSILIAKAAYTGYPERAEWSLV